MMQFGQYDVYTFCIPFLRHLQIKLCMFLLVCLFVCLFHYFFAAFVSSFICCFYFPGESKAAEKGCLPASY